jgi:predicted HicB family RNase H-like nuclease
MFFLILVSPALVIYGLLSITSDKPMPMKLGRSLKRLHARFEGDVSRMNQVASFTQTVARIQATVSMSGQEKASAISTQYEKSRRQLAAAGQLTPRVERELEALVYVALTAILQQACQMGESLNDVLKAYKPRRLRGSLK